MNTVVKSLCIFLLGCCTAIAAPAIRLPRVLEGVGIDQRLNADLPLDTPFRDENGSIAPLRSWFGKRPVLLVPVYYRCPMLCSQILRGVVAGLRPLSLRPGKDFDIVVFSIDPSEDAEDARAKRDFYTRRYSSSGSVAGWHFLTGTQSSIDALTAAIGFHYRRDTTNGMFIHASGVMIVTPEGRLARYLYGVEYQPKDLKLGLIEASHNRIGSRVDQVLLFCYHYEPSTGKYSLVVLNTLKLAGVLTVLLGFTSLFLLWRRDLKRDRQIIAGGAGVVHR
jgi:protein SCO1/2